MRAHATVLLLLLLQSTCLEGAVLLVEEEAEDVGPLEHVAALDEQLERVQQELGIHPAARENSIN